MARWPKTVLAGLALAGAGGSLASGAPATLQGRVLGADAAGGIWLGIVGGEAGGGEVAQARWSFVEGERFEIEAPAGERSVLLVIAKDRVLLAVPVRSDARSRSIELRLERGLALAGIVRAGDGKAIRGAEIAVARSNALFRNAQARAGFAELLGKSDTGIELADGRRVAIPAFARPRWRTNRRGEFRIGGLQAGRYVLEASAKGYVPVRSADLTIRKDAPSTAELVLHTGFFVGGHVVDRDEAPAPGAEVHADWLQPTAEPYRQGGELVHRVIRRRSTAHADDAGAFRIGPFEAGPAIAVRATAPQRGSSRRQQVRAPQDGLVLELRRDAIRGRVVDAATGEPIEIFQLHMHRNGRTHSTHHVDGRFEVQADPDMDALHIDSSGRFPWFSRISMGRGGVQDLGTIALESARSIAGRVRNAETGEPIAGALVRGAWQHYEDPLLRVFARNRFGSRGVRTRADGAFALGGLPQDADRIEIIAGDAQRTRSKLVDLPRGATRIDIDVAFDSAISGSLALADGTPIEGIATLVADGGSRLRMEVAEDGAFRFDGLEGGSYRLSAQTDRGIVESRKLTVDAGESLEGLHLLVQTDGRIAGAIRGLARTEQATVSFRDPRERLLLRRDYANGAYSVQGVSEAASVTTRTSAGRVLARVVQWDEQREAKMDFDFSGNARLTGAVLSGGRFVAGMELAILPEDRTQPMAYATTDERGRYAVQGLASGPHAVRTRTGYSYDVHIERDAVLDIDLPLNALDGVVRDRRTGNAIIGARATLTRVLASADSQAVALAAQVAAGGSFRFQGLLPGEYIARISHREFRDVSRRIRIDGLEAVELQMDSIAVE